MKNSGLFLFYKMMKKKWEKRIRRLMYLLIASFLVFIILDLIFPYKIPHNYSPIIRASNGEVLHANLSDDEQWRMYTHLHEMSPDLKKVFIQKEDRFFYYHLGVNPLSIARAAFYNIVYGKRTSGASTITMQVARMLEPKERNYKNKIVEIFRALQLELHYSKDEILQLYINRVPYGSNIQGVKAASLLYFDKFPEQLSLAEVVTLAIVPNRPSSLLLGKKNEYVLQERNKWIYKLSKKNLFSEEIIQDALAEPLNVQRLSIPRLLPQMSYRILRQFPDSTDIQLTIDYEMQTKVAELTKNYIYQQKKYNIHNASVLVLDNKTMELKAYVGSADFSDFEHHGQVDGNQAIRSPGSALKPFVYALAIDQGVITPRTMISDVPVNFEGYMPENYDLKYNGNVSAADALRKSLNIPAVKVLNEVGVYQLLEKLYASGHATLWNQKRNVGLSLILGGCGVKPIEMIASYAMLANFGKARNIHYLKSDTSNFSAQVFSPQTAQMVTNILSELQREDFPAMYNYSADVPRIAWKTGTSYGRRDAWSIGYNQQFTICVWIGNFSGEGVPDLSGANTATPLLFQLFSTLDKNKAAKALKVPVEHRLVCTESGKLPNTFCSNFKMDEYLPSISSNELCDHLKEFQVSTDGRFSFCNVCLPQTGYKTKLYPNIEPDLALYYQSERIDYEKLPPHNLACSKAFDGYFPRIQTLTHRATYWITNKNEQKLVLQASVANDVDKVFWYVNDVFIGSCAPAEKLSFTPTTTKVKVSCTDDKGRNTDVEIAIKFI